jgi:hypothetical protein
VIEGKKSWEAKRAEGRKERGGGEKSLQKTPIEEKWK